MATIKRIDRKPFGGLYPIYINPWTGEWGEKQFSMGAFGDSFYEYLLKTWIFSGRQDNEARLMYTDAIEAAMSKLLHVSSLGGLVYFADEGHSNVQHLACFSGIDESINYTI